MKTRLAAFFVALLISTGILFPSLFARQANADWVQGLDLARNSSNLPDQYGQVVVLTVLLWLLLIFTYLSVIAFVIAGIMFLTAGGDTQRAESAKNAVKYSIIGIATGISGYVIIRLIDSFMRGSVDGAV